MSEWIVQGNKPRSPKFTGELTERQQEMIDQWEAQERLSGFLADACRNCMWADYDVINPTSYKVVDGRISKEDAIKTVVTETRDCTGPEVDERHYDADPICPVHERLKPNKRRGF